MQKLIQFGWTKELTGEWRNFEASGLWPARVVADFGTSLRVVTPEVTIAELSGKLAHHSSRESVPKVGDWVAVRLLDNGPAVIEAVLPRRNEFARKAPGNLTVKQVIASNIDVAFVLLALDADFSPERLKRYMYQLTTDHIEPVVVLNKADAAEHIDGYVSQLASIKAPVIICSALNGTGVDDILARILPGRTAILVGSSGVGKSTLTNRLLGRHVQETQAVRATDSTGRHTTVHRELFVLPNGGLLIDTPGIRELQLWGTQEDLNESYDDITAIVARCKYSTCRHSKEAGCAIRQALKTGVLSAAHFANYKKMKNELVMLKAKTHGRKQLANRRSDKFLQRQATEGLKDMKDQIDDI